MKSKFRKKDLKKMIFSNTSKLSKEEIKTLIDKELTRNPEDVDTDYIDLCFELMSTCEKTENNIITVKPKRVKKTIMVAAVITVLCVCMISVSAIYFNIPEKISQLVNGNAELQYPMENTDTTADGYALLETDLAKELETFGITPVTFPEALVEENCKITKIENTTIDETISLNADIYFSYNGFKGNLMIFQSAPYDEITGIRTVMNIKSGEKITVNGMDVLVFEQEENCTIVFYKDGLTEYDITLYTTLETAKEFAKTIK
ncbi:MAG: hypothetical protein ACI4IF_07850 [Acutalibacteraceae bacterium]